MINYIRNKIVNYLFNLLKTRFEEEKKQKLIELKKRFKLVGENFSIGENYRIPDARNIEIGKNFRASERFRAEVFFEIEGKKTDSRLIIGNDIIFQTDVHLACINRIEIGDGCLFASRIFITDHSHGNTSLDSIKHPPRLRPIISKGPVIIGKNVWVGEGVSILANVHIGDNAIIGANSVVNKDVPENGVVAGVPAELIKIMI